jgi:phosphoglycerate dehydrogenase-like enzyme
MSCNRSRILVAASVAFLAHALAQADTTDAQRTASMIAELGLIEAPQPVRESPQWRKPARIVVREATPERLLWLSDAAPGVKLLTAMSPEEAAKLARGADAVLGYCTPEVLDAGTEIRWIQSYFAGVESCVAIPAMHKREVLLTNMQKVAGPVMAEHVMAMVLSFARGLNVYVDAQRNGQWSPELVGSQRAFTLQGKTMFVAGLGGIGTEVAKRAHALGMTVVATRASNRPAPDFVSRVGNASDQTSMVRQADFVVDTLPLTPATHGNFNARVFSQMKPTAYFINVGRGGTVVTADLVAALQAKTIAGAGLDVTDPEPLPPDHPLWKMQNVIITPHVSSNADVDENKRWLLVRENLRRYVAGERMLSVVDQARGY